MKKTFYITTPIYYSNSVPHVGHAYASLIADVLARYHRFIGDDVKFSTGVDENSQKVIEKANEINMGVFEYCDYMAEKHKAVWDGLNISYTDFIRTTNDEHKKLVQEVLMKSYNNGDIYLGEYKGLFCEGCEEFKKETDLTIDGLCPHHLKKPSYIVEKNYFFKLSKYQKAIEKLFLDIPDFVTPKSRFNEVIQFVKDGLEDFSVSRETSKFGIPIPFDSKHVTYVWYDALFNYITTINKGYEHFWPANVHVVGKDIVRFHAVFWPAMLMSAGYKIPHKILTTGFFTIDGQKISKSLGNVIDPVFFCEEYSRDLLLLYILSIFPIGSDGDFSTENAKLMFNAKLVNNLGNILNRFLVLSLKMGGKIYGKIDIQIKDLRDIMLDEYIKSMEKFDLKSALDTVFKFCSNLNKYIDFEKPWTLNENIEKEKIISILYTVGEGIRTIALCLSPFFENKMFEIIDRLGVSYQKEELIKGNFMILLNDFPTFYIKEKGNSLYTKIDKFI